MPFNFYAPEIRAAYEAMKAAGVEVGELRDHGDLLEFQFQDPDGNSLGMVWFEEKQRNDAGHPGSANPTLNLQREKQ